MENETNQLLRSTKNEESNWVQDWTSFQSQTENNQEIFANFDSEDNLKPTFQIPSSQQSTNNYTTSSIPLLPPMPPELELQFSQQQFAMEPQDQYLRGLEKRLLSIQKENAKKSPFEDQYSSLNDGNGFKENIKTTEENSTDDTFYVENEEELKKPLLLDEERGNDESPSNEIQTTKETESISISSNYSKIVVSIQQKGMKEVKEEGEDSAAIVPNQRKQKIYKEENHTLDFFPPFEQKNSSSDKCCRII